MNFCKPKFPIKTELCNEHQGKFFKGTTTLAFKCKDGIVVAVDSRATSGPYIASQSVNKIIEISDDLIGTMAGGAADCFYWEKLVAVEKKRYLLEGRNFSTFAAAKYLSDNLYKYKGKLSVGSLFCGTGEIYYVDDSGAMIPGDVFSAGSGSTIAYGLLTNADLKNLCKEDAIELGRAAISHAAHRDAYSGGTCTVYFMQGNKYECIGKFCTSEPFE